MTSMIDERDNYIKVEKLYKYAGTSIAIHLLIAGLLALMVWQTIALEYIVQGAAVLVCALLLNVLCHLLFKRNKLRSAQSLKKWETTYACSALLTNGFFAAAYCYIILLGDASLWLTTAFIVALHLGAMLLPYLNSVKVMITALLSVSLPIVAALVMISQPLAMVYAGAIVLYTSVLLFSGFSVYRLLTQGYVMESKYLLEAKLSKQYKLKLDSTTIEDQQTRIFNRRFFNLMINEEIRRAKRSGHELTIAIIEIDCYTEYLEKYGQTKADKCVISIAKILSKATSRGGEFLTRFEDDKFALIAPNVPTAEAIAFTSKMKDAVSNAEIEHQHTEVENLHHISISVGIAQFKPNNIIDIDEIVGQAQLALGTARKEGRNNIQVFGERRVRKESSDPTITDINQAKPRLVNS